MPTTPPAAPPDAPATEMIPVLCCCDPSNLLGHAPAGLELQTRTWETEGGFYRPGTGIWVDQPESGAAYVGEQLELSEWLDLPGFEPEPEIHLRRALELLEDTVVTVAREIGEDDVTTSDLSDAIGQIELARKPKRPKPKPTRTWKETKK